MNGWIEGEWEGNNSGGSRYLSTTPVILMTMYICEVISQGPWSLEDLF